jgi:hypothetical protein
MVMRRRLCVRAQAETLKAQLEGKEEDIAKFRGKSGEELRQYAEKLKTLVYGC